MTSLRGFQFQDEMGFCDGREMVKDDAKKKMVTRML